MIGLGVERTHFADDGTPTHDPSTMHVGYVGRLERWKGVDVLYRDLRLA